MADITLEQVQKICGNYTSKNGYNYNFRCPICTQEGGDKHGDNLVYNSNRQIIKCFKNEEHTLKVLSMINNLSKDNNFGLNYKPLGENEFSIKQLNKKPIWEERQEKYVEYMVLAQEILLQDKSLLDYIYKKRKLDKDILDLCGIGFDNTENCFTIPIFSLKYDCITDFELRQYGEKKIRRIGGGCNTIAKIWGINKAKTLYIVEGFIDGITLAQYLLYDKRQTNFTIYSCSNGVSSLVNVLVEINFKNFDEIKLMLDNDTAGDEATKKIIEKYQFIKDSRQFLVDSNCKDFSEWYVSRK